MWEENRFLNLLQALELPSGYWLAPYDFGQTGLTSRPHLVTIREVTLDGIGCTTV